MPVIPSAISFDRLNEPSANHGYRHPVETRGSGPIPMAFQITSPLDFRTCLLPHALVLHVNPESLSENHTKKVEVMTTMGGFVEDHWYDELSEMSGNGSTGAFLNLYTGLSSVTRRDTVAWNRYRDLYDLFRNNGSVYDPTGKIVLQGKVMLLFDRGTYLGRFTSFSVEETAESPYAFKLDWSFKIDEVVLKVPSSITNLQPLVSTSDQTLQKTTDARTTSGGTPATQQRLPRPSAAEDAVRESANSQLTYEFQAGLRDQQIGVFDNPLGNVTLKK